MLTATLKEKGLKVKDTRSDGSLVYVGITRKLIDVSKDDIKILKKKAADQETTVKDLIEKLIKDYCKRVK